LVLTAASATVQVIGNGEALKILGFRAGASAGGISW